jgi:hypothetical protein
MEAELCSRRAGMNPEFVYQEHRHQKNAGRKQERDEVRDLVPVTE